MPSFFCHRKAPNIYSIQSFLFVFLSPFRCCVSVLIVYVVMTTSSCSSNPPSVLQGPIGLDGPKGEPVSVYLQVYSINKQDLR